jgi:MFS family permease
MDGLSLSTADRRRSLAAVITCMTLVGVTVGLTYPLLSLILEERGYSSTIIGLNAAMPAIAMLILSPFLPHAIQRIGLKPFLTGCILAEAALILGLRAFDTIYFWFALRFFMGITAAGLFIAGETWINQIADDRNRGRLMAVYSIAMSGGLALGPVILTITGTGGWSPFVAGALCNLVGLVPLMTLGNLAPRLDGHASFSVWSFVRIAPSLSMSVFAFAVIESAGSALLPIYGIRTGYSDDASALMLTIVLVGGIALQWPIGWLADHSNRYLLIGSLGLLSAIGIGLLPLVAMEPVLLYAALFVWGGIAAGVYTVALVIQGQRFRGADLITANAAFGLIWGVASMGGPAAAGVAMDLWDPHGLPALLMLVCLAAAITVWVRHHGRRPRPTATVP